MSRPTNKADLLAAMIHEYEKLIALIAPLDEMDQISPGICVEWSVKDILAHLYAWQQMLLGWYRAGERGEVVKTPAPDLKWSETPVLNQRIYDQYRDAPLAEIWAQFKASHLETYDTLSSIPEEALVTPRFYRWTNTSTLLSYFVSATASHYVWAATEIRKGLKQRATPASRN